MCYGVLGNLFSFGDCKKDFPKAQYSLSVSSIKSQIKNSVAKTNQQSKIETVGSQVQRVMINGYTSGSPDIIVSQRMNVKVASSTKLSGAISDKVMVNAAEAIDSQLESLVNANPVLRTPKNKKIISNIQASVQNILRSDSAKYAVQQKMLNTLSIQNQEIIINFAEGVTPKVVNNPETVTTKFHDGRPVIEIDQNLINNMFVETAMESIIGEIVNNSELQKLTHELEKSMTTPSKVAKSEFIMQASQNEETTTSIENKRKENHIKSFYIFLFIILFFLIIFFFISNKQ
jgi:hypothetical protein